MHLSSNSKDSPFTEKYMINHCYPYFKCRHKQMYLEMPVFTASADMVAINQSEITAIEFKINDWRRAINQARRHLLSVDYSYICVPMPKTAKTKKRVEEEAINSGLGLYYYSIDEKQPVSLVKPAPRSSMIWSAAKERLIKRLDERERRLADESC